MYRKNRPVCGVSFDAFVILFYIRKIEILKLEIMRQDQAIMIPYNTEEVEQTPLVKLHNINKSDLCICLLKNEVETQLLTTQQ